MLKIVSGAPCSGKSTLIASQAKKGDVIIDMDKIALALMVDGDDHDYGDDIKAIALSARQAAYRKALQYCQDRTKTFWIIHTEPKPSDVALYRIYSAEFIVCDPGLDECLKRVKSRPASRRMLSEKAIREWYAVR
jgi:predicted kinase